MDKHHVIIDADTHFKIDGITRAIINVSEVKTMLMQGDHNSERFTFELPRYIDGHDMSECNVCQIHYVSAGENGIYEVDDLKVDDDKQDLITLSWLISGSVTKFTGSLNFVIRFSCVVNDVIEYVWNTAIFKGVTIATSICNSEQVVQEYTDVLEEWRDKLFSTYEHTVEVTLTANGWVESQDQTHFTQDVVIPNVTANTKIDLQPSPEQLVLLIRAGITMFIANDNGSVKVYSVGDKLTNDMTIQVTVKEVNL